MQSNQPSTRHVLRLKGYDYSAEGAYFITIVTQNRSMYFGEIIDDSMHLSPAGEMIQHTWEEISTDFSYTILDVFCVMPNHFHGILTITEHNDSNQVSLPEIVQWFKTRTTNRYIQGIQTSHWRKFEGKLWQRSYYDHIIRDEEDLARVQTYILANPINWVKDEEYPS